MNCLKKGRMSIGSYGRQRLEYKDEDGMTI
jgi:hypothetical protein